MKKCFITLVLVSLIVFQGFSQLKIPTGSRSEINRLLNSTTYIVLNNERMSDFNMAMRDAAESFWTITPYEFIYTSDFHEQRFDSDKSFLVINQVIFERDRSETKFDFLILTLGGPARTINDMPTLCAVPLSYTGAPVNDYAYKLGVILKFVQKHIETTRDNPHLNEDNIADFYVDKSKSLSSKTLYVIPNELESRIRSYSDFSSSYAHSFSFSTKSEIEELINNSDNNAVIMHKIGPRPNSGLSRCIKIIIDVGNADIYYYDSHNVNNRNPNALLRSDLRAMSRL